jgi:3-oxoacyl-[acyl-carrier-protein] synthase III
MTSIIESLGVYLPPRQVSTAEIVAGCRSPLLFPIERLTGIHSRRVAGDTEFSIDLAKQAVVRCLHGSKYEPRDIDLLVCCNISRCDAPENAFTFEPSTAVRLRHHFGFDQAVAFDITNACAGMFTGIHIADAALKTGRIRRAMVVSGEHISHLIRTAQQEIAGFMDPRLACLTVGDAGAALILEQSVDPEHGFLDLEIYTLGDYAQYCVAKATDREHGGAIMLTDAIRLAAVSIRQGVAHAIEVQQRNGWRADGFDHLIMHQTSENTLNDTAKEINRRFGRDICTSQNTVNNLGARGNTASTTHFVALMDNILAGRIHSGHQVVFGISGSGLTTGTAIYALDDLPDRLRRAELDGTATPKQANGGAPRQLRELPPRVRVESVVALDALPAGRDPLAAARVAAQAALAGSTHAKEEVGLLLFSGVYRPDFISEPAVAALLAGELAINSGTDSGAARTLALDVLNGALGCLNACFVATQMIRADQSRVALICAAEVENNAVAGKPARRGLREAASALVLDCQSGETGFGGFVFRAGSAQNCFRSYTRFDAGTPYLVFEPGGENEDELMQLVREAVQELLDIEEASLEDVQVVLPPQTDSRWIAALAQALGLPRERCIDVCTPQGDLFTSSLAFALRSARETGRARPGDLGLIVAVGSGRQVGCATYHF